MKNFKIDMNSCKKYSDIMDDVERALSENGIEYEKASKNEIVVLNKTKKEVSKIIQSLTIPQMVIYLMLNITELKKKIYIRKKVK